MLPAPAPMTTESQQSAPKQHSSIGSSVPMPSAQAAPALARYLKQQTANRLAVQQRGAALREVEQEARRRAAAEAPRVLNQLEADARRKIAMAVRPENAARWQRQDCQPTASSVDHAAASSSGAKQCSSARRRSKSAVWPSSSASSSSVCEVNGPMHPLQQGQRQHQQQPSLTAQAGRSDCQLAAAGVQACCLQEGRPEAAGVIQQPRQQAWHQQLVQPEQQRRPPHHDVRRGLLQQPAQQQRHQPRPAGQPDLQPLALRQQFSRQLQEQHIRSSSSGSHSNSSCSERPHSSRDSCGPLAAGSHLHPLLPQQPSRRLCTGRGTAAAAEQQQGSVALQRPGSPVAQMLCAIACHAAAPRGAGSTSADPLKEPLLGQ
ncbi:hypothetical protein COO60DRAFT_1509385 [Scenedesmus sp. NREL 46B-D3]|nr:hypothetical protein COO60DRAFT_1509385 [Scenedesmus sp. NREL 46B-D3]